MKSRKYIYIPLIFIIAIMCTGCSHFLHSSLEEKVYLAVSNNNVQGLKEALEENGKINLEKLPYGIPSGLQTRDHRALEIALDEPVTPNAQIIEMLIDAGADVNSVDKKSSMSEDYSYLMSIIDNEEIANVFLDNGVDVNIKDETGKTALDYLMLYARTYEKDKIHRIKASLENAGAKVSSETLNSCLENGEGGAYTYSKEVLQELLDAKQETGVSNILQDAILGDDINFQKDIKAQKIDEAELQRVLTQAAANCNRSSLELLVSQGYELNATDEANYSMYHIASAYNDKDVVAYFLSQGEDKNKKCGGFDEINALTVAAIGGKKDTAEMLLQQGVSWQTASESDTWTEACRLGDAASIDLMLDCGYEPTDREIWAGYQCCNTETVAELLKRNIPFDGEFGGETVLDSTCLSNEEVTMQLFHEGAKVTAQTLTNVILNGYDELAKEMVSKCDDLDIFYPEATPLTAAIETGNFPLVKQIVEQGADINYVIDNEECNYGKQYTAMHVAAMRPSNEILKYLIEQGGDVDKKDGDGKTPYDWAKEVGLEDNQDTLK